MEKRNDFEKIMQVLHSKGIKVSKGEGLAGLGVGTIALLAQGVFNYQTFMWTISGLLCEALALDI